MRVILLQTYSDDFASADCMRKKSKDSIRHQESTLKWQTSISFSCIVLKHKLLQLDIRSIPLIKNLEAALAYASLL